MKTSRTILAVFALLVLGVSEAGAAWTWDVAQLSYTGGSRASIFGMGATGISGKVVYPATPVDPESYDHAAYWSYGTAGTTWTDLSAYRTLPFTNSGAAWIDGDLAAGDCNDPLKTTPKNAMVWNVTTNSYLRITPTGTNTETKGQGIDGFDVVGREKTSTGDHAAIWTVDSSLTTWTFKDLNPDTSTSSYLFNADSGYQVGYATLGSRQPGYWHGTAASWVQLGKIDANRTSAATGLDVEDPSGKLVIGGKSNDASNYQLPVYWPDAIGAPLTYVVLDASATATTHKGEVYALDGGYQVGHYGNASIGANLTHAALWDGTAESLVDLNSLFVDATSSIARGIYVSGNDIWIGMNATVSGTEQAYLIHTTILPGDANRDGTVDNEDASILGANWLTSGAMWEDGDFNHDRAVNDKDAAILAANWSPGGGGGEVPEPSTLAMLLGAAVMAWLVRRRSR